jgi:hypothetical protein
MTVPGFKLATKCAHWGWDDHRYFGYSVFEELAGSESMTGIAALSVLGRRLPKECCEVLDDIVCASTLADPRIWPLKMTRLIAAYGGIMPAAAAGLLVQEGARIGPWTLGASAQVLCELYSEVAGHEQDPDCVMSTVERYLRGRGMIAGFGTPYRHVDERLRAFQERMKARGRNQLPYWRAMEAITHAARQLRRSEPNISIAVAAALLDMGVSTTEVAPLVTSLCHHMFFANAVEGAQQAPAVLRQLPAEHVCYVGRPPRVSPRSTQRVSMMQYREKKTG